MPVNVSSDIPHCFNASTGNTTAHYPASTTTSHYLLSSPHHSGHLHSVYLIGFPILITLGVAANLLDLWVLSQPNMRGVAFRYLARLAISDLLYLIFNIPFCLRDFALTSEGLLSSEASAIYYAFLAVPVVNFFQTLSVYIIVWLSYDRCLAVCNPQRFPAKQRLAVVHKRCVLTLFVTLIMYIPTPFALTYSCSQFHGAGCCVHDSTYRGKLWFIIYEYIRETYARFLPGVLITACNVGIIVVLRRARKRNAERKKIRDSKLFGIRTQPSLTDSQKSRLSTIKTQKELTDSPKIYTSKTTPIEALELHNKVSRTDTTETVDVNIDNSATSKIRRSFPVKSAILSHALHEITPTSFNPGTSNRSETRADVISEARNERELRLVLLLLAITILFYISSFPSALYKINRKDENQQEKLFDVFRAVADMLEVSGHVFNFVLYFLLSPDFRRTLASLPQYHKTFRAILPSTKF